MHNAFCIISKSRRFPIHYTSFINSLSCNLNAYYLFLEITILMVTEIGFINDFSFRAFLDQTKLPLLQVMCRCVACIFLTTAAGITCKRTIKPNIYSFCKTISISLGYSPNPFFSSAIHLKTYYK